MKIANVLVVLTLALAVHGSIDFAAMRKKVAQLQSACDRESEDEFAHELEDIANSMPDDVVFRGLGISTGPRTELVLVRTQSLFGSKYTIPLNPMRRTNEECLYVDETYAGPIVFVTEEPTSIKTCKYSRYEEMTTSLHFNPVFAEGNTIQTSQKFKREAVNGFSYIYRKDSGYTRGKSSVAVEAGKINPDSFTDSDGGWILAGSVIQLRFGATNIKYFAVAVALQVRKDPRATTFIQKHRATAELNDSLAEVLRSADIGTSKN